jgi:hypothetical protein
VRQGNIWFVGHAQIYICSKVELSVKQTWSIRFGESDLVNHTWLVGPRLLVDQVTKKNMQTIASSFAKQPCVTFADLINVPAS